MEKKSFRIVAIVFLVILGVILFVILKDDNNINNENENQEIQANSDALKFKEEYEAINDIGNAVQINIPNNSPIEYLTFEEFDEKLKVGSAFALYLGFPTCPWCRNVINPLFEVASSDNAIVYYINVKELNDDDYNRLYNLLYDYLEENASGVRTLYVPDVYFFKDSKVVGHHLSSVESQENPYIPLNESQVEELKNIYQNLFDKLK